MEIKFTHNEQEYTLKRPGVAVEREAREVYTKNYSRLLKEGELIPRSALPDLLESNGVWDKEKEQEKQELFNQIEELLKPLESGGIPLSEMKQRAEQAKEIRLKVLNKVIKQNSYDHLTIESVAEDIRFTFLLSNALYLGEERVFPSFEALDQCSDVELISAASLEFVKMNSGDFSFDHLPENKFLKDYGLEEKSADPEITEFKPFLDEDGKPIIK